MRENDGGGRYVHILYVYICVEREDTRSEAHTK